VRRLSDVRVSRPHVGDASTRRGVLGARAHLADRCVWPARAHGGLSGQAAVIAAQRNPASSRAMATATTLRLVLRTESDMSMVDRCTTGWAALPARAVTPRNGGALARNPGSIVAVCDCPMGRTAYVSTVEEVKAGVARFGDEVGQQIGAIRASAEALDRSGAMLRNITSGSGHARVSETLARLEQAKQKLAEAATLAQSAVESSRGYAASF